VSVKAVVAVVAGASAPAADSRQCNVHEAFHSSPPVLYTALCLLPRAYGRGGKGVVEHARDSRIAVAGG
jgi:hypothetical protein